MKTEKSKIKDIDRSFYDFKKEDNSSFKVKKGLTDNIVRQISKEKNEPRLDASVQARITGNLQ